MPDNRFVTLADPHDRGITVSYDIGASQQEYQECPRPYSYQFHEGFPEQNVETTEVTSLNLQQTVQALEQKGILVLTDVGVHRHCDINSNCPVAVELRRFIQESGTTLPDLIEGFAATQVPPPVPLSEDEYRVDGKTQVIIGGHTISLDLTDMLKEKIESAWNYKLRELNRSLERVQVLGERLYHTYLGKIDNLYRTRALPMPNHSASDILKYGCYLAKTEDIGDSYLYIFPREYNPQYLVRDGIRYRMAKEDVQAIRRPVNVVIVIRDQKILRVEVVDQQGRGFYHYHGEPGGDCWGNVVLPQRWDGSLQGLTDVVRNLMGSLATINMNSLMHRDPDDMPEIGDVMDRSTEMGEEGVIQVPSSPQQSEGGTRWGQGWGGRQDISPDEVFVDVVEELDRQPGR